MAVNKVQFGNQTIMDITDTSTTSEDVVEGQVFYNAAGVRSVGSLTDATTATHGLMSTADKTKLDGIEAGAQANPSNATTAVAGLMSADDKIKLNRIYPEVSEIIYQQYIKSVDDRILYYPGSRHNLLAFLPANQIIILKTTDGGTTWVDAEVSDENKCKLFSTYDAPIELPQINNETTSNCGLCIIFTTGIFDVPNNTAETDKAGYWIKSNQINKERSFYVSLFHLKFVSADNTLDDIRDTSIQIQYHSATSSSWTNFASQTQALAGSDVYVNKKGWSNMKEPTIIQISLFPSGSSTDKRKIIGILAYSPIIFKSPNSMMSLDHLYSYDYLQNAIFPNKITAVDFIGKVSSTTLTIINDAACQGNIYVNCDSNFSNGQRLATEAYVSTAISNASIGGGGVSVPMTGATTTADGSSGLVPAPTTADVGYFLSADATWKPGGKPMVVLSYGSSTWDDFINAYNDHVIVYCKASSNSNPASGNQTRQAFMAYVNSDPPTEVEFQYYRSVSSHSSSQLGDQVFIYKLSKTNGWSVTTREASMKEFKVESGSNMSVTWSSNKLTLHGTALPAVTTADNGKILMVVDGAWAVVTPS